MGHLNFVAIDPGLRGCGVAWFRDGRLKEAAYVESRERTARGADCFVGMADAVHEWRLNQDCEYHYTVIELPQVYQSKHQKGDQDDLVQLAGVVGAICQTSGDSVETVRPREWKGTIAKEVMTRRIESRLDEDEKAAIVRWSAALDHNILDAVGIGLWYLGRLNGSAD